ncbi:hypothetical protein BDZ45DRAFT_751779 [Acephala macrosclerotiorum]|nr:hypothetical protein BDZ45DRAFT_751779 [Acephala macrosclerotiorum]
MPRSPLEARLRNATTITIKHTNSTHRTEADPVKTYTQIVKEELKPMISSRREGVGSEAPLSSESATASYFKPFLRRMTNVNIHYLDAQFNMTEGSILITSANGGLGTAFVSLLLWSPKATMHHGYTHSETPPQLTTSTNASHPTPQTTSTNFIP